MLRFLASSFGANKRRICSSSVFAVFIVALCCLLLPDGTGLEVEDLTTERTPAQCLLDALRAHEDPLSLEDKIFSRPLSVTAPKVSVYMLPCLIVSQPWSKQP